MKQLFFGLILTTAISLHAQPYLSVTATTKGEGLSIGYLEEQSGIEFSTGYQVNAFNAEMPTLFYLSLGKRILLSHQEEDNFSITPFIGYAHYFVKDFSGYENYKGNDAISSVNEIRAIYKLELGKDWYLGRLYVSANYCKKAFWGIGIRAFIK